MYRHGAGVVNCAQCCISSIDISLAHGDVEAALAGHQAERAEQHLAVEVQVDRLVGGQVIAGQVDAARDGQVVPVELGRALVGGGGAGADLVDVRVHLVGVELEDAAEPRQAGV